MSNVAAKFAIKKFDALPPRGGGTNAAYPFAETNPGEYFTIPLPDKETDAVELAKKISTMASQMGKKHSRKFRVRTVEDDEGNDVVGVYCLTEDMMKKMGLEA